jgi:hypothetical protein
MIKSILVPATGTETDLISLRTAMTIARDFSAHIATLHVRFDAVDVAVKTASGHGGLLVANLVQQLEQDANEREIRAKRTFENFCRRESLRLVESPESTPSPSAQWHMKQETKRIPSLPTACLPTWSFALGAQPNISPLACSLKARC